MPAPAITFSSPIDPARFTEFSLSLDSGQSLETLRDETQLRFGLSFAGSGVRAGHAKLKSLAVINLLNGAPSMTLDGYLVAAAIGQGELVTITAPVYQLGATDDTETISRVGIITDLVWTGGPGGSLVQRLDLVFHACHRLHVRSSGTVTTLTDPAAEDA